jgi:hypothetical protein
MKKQLMIALLSAAAAFAQGRGPGGPGGFGSGGFGPGPGFGRGMEMRGRVVTGAPYSGTETLTTQEKFADGNSVNTSRTTERARDGQGRTFSSETITPAASAGKAPYTRTTIIDPVAGLRYELNSSAMIAYESRIPRMRPRESNSAPPAPTASTRTLRNGATQTITPLGTQSVNGVQATGTQITEVIPAGAIGNAQPITSTRITWVSNDLHIPVQIKTTDPRIGSTDMELTNISTGEPSATLFAVPSTYTIQKGGRRMGRGLRGPDGASGRRGGPGPFGRRGGPPRN